MYFNVAFAVVLLSLLIQEEPCMDGRRMRVLLRPCRQRVGGLRDFGADRAGDLPGDRWVENASLYFNVAFAVVLLSLLIQGGTLPWMARRMRVLLPPMVTPNRRGPLGIQAENDFEMGEQ
ncbi:K(+)/H(+) antiporter NhaP2 [Halomonas elongata]|uniref:K(+)/H(+) antiporter NhaP2 n=1 Tax=Halomonas elongata TaxID=2746 RepID=A0A1B8P216_HALEL|nr:K(+)/H(+) antiporter NhaP2 [Halomonas elongata]